MRHSFVKSSRFALIAATFSLMACGASAPAPRPMYTAEQLNNLAREPGTPAPGAAGDDMTPPPAEAAATPPPAPTPAPAAPAPAAPASPAPAAAASAAPHGGSSARPAGRTGGAARTGGSSARPAAGH